MAARTPDASGSVGTLFHSGTVTAGPFSGGPLARPPARSAPAGSIGSLPPASSCPTARRRSSPARRDWGDEASAFRPLYRLDQRADHLAFTSDGRTLLGVGQDGMALAWHPRNGTRRETIRMCEPGTFAIRDIAVAPYSRHVAAWFGKGAARSFWLRPEPETVAPWPTLPPVSARPEAPVDLRRRLIAASVPHEDPGRLAGPPVAGGAHALRGGGRGRDR